MAAARRLSRINWVLIAIIAFGLILRAWGINYGLPYTYGPDEPTYVTITLQMFKTGDLNPHWWYYPSLMFYLNAVALLMYFVIGRLFGVLSLATPAAFPNPEVITMGVGHLALPAEFLVARGMTALFSAAAILLVYAIGRRLFGIKWVAIVAALFFAVSPTIINLSHRFAPDLFAMFFALVSFYFVARILDDGRTRNYVFAGIGAGLAIASKYNAGLVLVALLAAHFVRFGRAGWRRKEIYGAVLIAVVVFIAATPFAVLDFRNFWDGVKWQAFSYSAEGHAGQEGGALVWYIGYLWQTEGAAFLLAVFSVLWLFYKRSQKNLLLIIYPLVYFGFASSLLVRNDRTILQIIPFIDIMAADVLFAVYEWVKKRLPNYRTVVAVALFGVLALCVIPSAYSVVAADLQSTQTDARETARVWIDKNIPPGSRIALEAYSPYVDTSRYAVHGDYAMIDQTPDWYVQNGYEYLIFSYGAYGRFYESPEQYSDAVAQYNTFFSRFPELIRFNNGGYEIRILKTDVAGLPSHRVEANFGVYSPMLELVGYDQTGGANLMLYWRATESRRGPLQLTAHLLDRNDQQVAETSGALFTATDADGRWPAGIVRVPLKIAAPNDAFGLYRVQLDVDAEGIGRIPVLSRANTPTSDKLYLGPIKIAPTPPSTDELQRASTSGAWFGNIFALEAYQADTTARAGDSLDVSLYWKSIAKTDKDYTIFVHLLDSSGKIRAQIDSQPRDGAYPTSIWDAGEVIRDNYLLSLPSDLAPGEYRIEVGAYEYPSLIRLPINSPDGKPIGDHLTMDHVVTIQ